MIKFIYKILAPFVLLNLLGCYQVTEGDLYEEYEPRVVIEAQISNLPPPYYVKLSYSAKPTDSVDFHPITNAEVFLSDNKDNSEYLTMISPGIYESDDLQGVKDIKYTLNAFILSLVLYI